MTLILWNSLSRGALSIERETIKASALVKQTEQGYIALVPQDDLIRNRNGGNESNGSRSIPFCLNIDINRFSYKGAEDD